MAMLNGAGIKCTTLTKGILPYVLPGFCRENEYGITLISVSEELTRIMEPGSAPLAVRIGSLKALHDAGCKTFVSIEPFPTPNIAQIDLREVLQAVDFVDKIIFGRLNYNKQVRAYEQHLEFYNTKAREVIQFCEERGIRWHIKEKTITDV